MDNATSPNILLVIADSVRAQNVSLYGHLNRTTPFLDSFASEATVYTEPVSPGTWSLPSHASIFTGYHVWEHRLTSFNDSLRPGHTIWEELADRGYTTGVFSTNPLLRDEEYGLNRGFDYVMPYVDSRKYPFAAGLTPTEFKSMDTYNDSRWVVPQYVTACLRQQAPLKSLLNGVAVKLEPGEPFEHSRLLPERLQMSVTNEARETVNGFLDWITETDKPWAACLNVMDAHQPYLPRESYNEWATDSDRRVQEETSNKDRWQFYAGQEDWWKCETQEELYDGCIRQIDAALHHLVATLRQRGLLDETLVVITSDHGEGFGEQSRVRDSHPVARHRSGVHEALLHVPLVVHSPYSKPSSRGQRLDGVATLTNFPTAVDRVLAGESAADAFLGDDTVYAAADYDSIATEVEKVSRGGIAERYLEQLNISEYVDPAQIVYENVDESVRKSVVWGEDRATIRIDAPRSATVVDETDDGRVASEYQSLEPRDVKMTLTDDIDVESKERLAQLGYL